MTVGLGEAEKGRESSCTGGNYLPTMLIFPPIYAGQAAVSYQERRQNPVLWSGLAVPQSISRVQPGFPPHLKSKIKSVQCLHVSLLSQQGAVCLPNGQGEAKAQAPGNLSLLSIHGYRGCWSFKV